MSVENIIAIVAMAIGGALLLGAIVYGFYKRNKDKGKKIKIPSKFDSDSKDATVLKIETSKKSSKKKF